MGRSKKSTQQRIYMLMGLFLAIVVLLGMTLWYAVVVPLIHEVRCVGNLANVRREICYNEDDVFLFIEGKPYFKDDMLLEIAFPEKKVTCPACKQTYIYRPVAPSGKRMKAFSEEPYPHIYFVMWCPQCCHKGRRAFLYTSLSVGMHRDSEVSWYYQTLVDNLTDGELKKENDYRVSHGMKPVGR